MILAIILDGCVFIVEKFGWIWIIEDGILLFDLFLSVEVDNYNECGLSGFVFDFGFEVNNYYYVFYIVFGSNFNCISCFIVNGNYILFNSEVIFMEFVFLNGIIYNGGVMVFGSDGKFYIVVGDGVDL